MSGTDPEELAEFQHKADQARRGVHRSLQRTASMPEAFVPSRGVVLDDDGDDPDGNQNQEDGGRDRRSSSSGYSPMFDAAIQPSFRITQRAAEQVNEAPTFLDDLTEAGFDFFENSKYACACACVCVLCVLCHASSPATGVLTL